MLSRANKAHLNCVCVWGGFFSHSIPFLSLFSSLSSVSGESFSYFIFFICHWMSLAIVVFFRSLVFRRRLLLLWLNGFSRALVGGWLFLSA